MILVVECLPYRLQGVVVAAVADQDLDRRRSLHPLCESANVQGDLDLGIGSAAAIVCVRPSSTEVMSVSVAGQES